MENSTEMYFKLTGEKDVAYEYMLQQWGEKIIKEFLDKNNVKYIFTNNFFKNK